MEQASEPASEPREPVTAYPEEAEQSTEMATHPGTTHEDATGSREPVPDQRSVLARKVSERFRRESPHYIRSFISVSFARLNSRVARALPVAARYWLADRFGDALYLLSRGYRKNVISNLSHVHAAIGRPAPTTSDVHTVYRTSSRNWADLLAVPGHTPRQFRSEVSVTPGSLERLDAAIARGKGCVLITAHLGAFDYMGHFLHAMGYKLAIVTGRTTARLVFDGVTYLRQSNGLGLVEATPSGVRKAIQSVMNGDCAVIVCDRDFFQNGVAVEFFGVKTTLPPGAVRIARDTGAAIVPVFGKRVPGGHEFSIYEPFTVEKTAYLHRDIEIGMAGVVTAMETAIAAIPDQWVMFQSVWPSAPDGSVA
jgi:phosphatidylinositol dimannoside acyltransferase